MGSGPFPTELNDETGESLRDIGREFGSTTGRARRCGWLDLPALKYSIMINGATQLFMTKADVMSGFNDNPHLHFIYSETDMSSDEMPFHADAG